MLGKLFASRNTVQVLSISGLEVVVEGIRPTEMTREIDCSLKTSGHALLILLNGVIDMSKLLSFGLPFKPTTKHSR